MSMTIAGRKKPMLQYVLVRLKQAEAGNEHLAVEIDHLHGLNNIVLADDMFYLRSIETED